MAASTRLLFDLPLAVLLLVNRPLLQVLSEWFISFLAFLYPTCAFHEFADVLFRDVARRQEILKLVAREEFVAILFEELSHLSIVNVINLDREWDRTGEHLFWTKET